MKLSKTKVEKIKTPGRYHDARGLVLVVSPGGGKHWEYRYQRNKRERWMGLGNALDQSIEDARTKAQEARKLLLAGHDPIEEKRSAAVASKAAAAAAIRFTFRDVAEQFIADVVDRLDAGKVHRDQISSSLRLDAYPTLGDILIRDVETEHILATLRPIWTAKAKTAKRVRVGIEKVLDFAKSSGFRSGENPARWRGHLESLLVRHDRKSLGKVIHHPSLPYGELAIFMAELRKVDLIPAKALEFAILCASRSGEIRGALWSEIDLHNCVWTIPGTRMKAGEPHSIPLSTRAVEILRGMIRVRGNDHVFPGRAGAINKTAMGDVLASLRQGVTVHGFRATFRTWAGDETSHAREICEVALAHYPSGSEGAYARGALLEKRRRLMNDFSSFAAGKSVRGLVVPLKKVRG